MRKIDENLLVKFSVTLSASGIAEIELPALGDRVAYLATGLTFNVSPASAVGTSVAAGALYQSVVLVREGQAVPASPSFADGIVDMLIYQTAAIGAGMDIIPTLSRPLYEADPRGVLFKELHAISLCLNMATFPTFDFNLVIDAYQLTTSEYVDLLD